MGVTFEKGNAAAARHSSGTKIVKLSGRKGFYLRWYERREKSDVLTITVALPHGLSLAPAPRNVGALVMQQPPARSPYADLRQGDVISAVGGVPVATPADFDTTLPAFAGKTIGIRVNKGGKCGTAPKFVKAGMTREEARDFQSSWKQIRDSRRVPGADSGVSFSTLCDEFLKWAKTSGGRRHSGYAVSWWRDVERITEALNDKWGARPIASFTQQDISSYLEERYRATSASTHNNHLTVLRKLFQFATGVKNYTSNNPADDVHYKTLKPTTPKYLSQDEISNMLDVARATDQTRLVPFESPKGGTSLIPFHEPPAIIRARYNADGTFDAARLQFLILTALRKSQFINLKWSQYDPKRGALTFQGSENKSGRVQVIPIPEDARAIIEGQPRISDYIFPSLTGGRDNEIASRLRRIFAKYKEQHGRHIHMHMMRHTGLTLLLKHSGNIAAVSAFAGHKDLKTTQRYAHVLESELKAITAGFTINPRGPKRAKTLASVGSASASR